MSEAPECSVRSAWDYEEALQNAGIMLSVQDRSQHIWAGRLALRPGPQMH